MFAECKLDNPTACWRLWTAANRWACLTDQYIASEETNGVYRVRVVPASAIAVSRKGWRSALV